MKSSAEAVRGISAENIRERFERFCAERGYQDVATYFLLATGRGTSLEKIKTEEGQQNLRKSLEKGAPIVLQLGIADAVITIKRNARLIFPDESHEGRVVCAKIGLPSAYRTGSLSREIKARKLLTRFNSGIPVPALLSYDNRLTWFEEEYIAEDKRISEFDKVKLFLTRYALRLYGATARPRPISISLQRFKINMTQLRDVFHELGSEMPSSIEQATWPVSLLHGDLGTSNILADSHNCLFLVDWEKCGVGPVAWDLRILYRDQGYLNHNSVDLVHEVLRALCSASDMSPRNQMLIALIMDLIHRRRIGKGEKEKKRLLALLHHQAL
jgi:tRNA A-37 threonylcarbamoyl transferase component Bud32